MLFSCKKNAVFFKNLFSNRKIYAILKRQDISKRNIHMKKPVFISYTTPDKEYADALVAFLEKRGIGCFIAPRDVDPGRPYAQNLMHAIDECALVLLVASEHINASEHVLNEICLAFQNLPDKIKFKPLRIDDTELSSSARYYLSRQHWMDAIVPPLEERLNEFVESIAAEL